MQVSLQQQAVHEMGADQQAEASYQEPRMTATSTSPSLTWRWGPHSSCTKPIRLSSCAVPFSKARGLLLEYLQGLAATASSATVSDHKKPVDAHEDLHFLRLEIALDDLEDEMDAISWLRAQSSGLPKIYLRIPEGSLIVAGLGAAHLVSGPDDIHEQRQALSGIPSCMAYYGGSRFDPLRVKSGPEWDGFGGGLFMLPAVELIRRRAASESGFILACNLRWEVKEKAWDPSSFLQQVEGAMAVVEGLVDDDRWDIETPPLPSPVACEDSAPFNTWNEGIGKALAAMARGDYRKVVLARASTYTFPCPLRPLDIVAYLRPHYGYLFCIQLSAHKAFLGCTPEQLFKVEGDSVSTEALAGTRPRGATPEEDQSLAQELIKSEKDLFENQVTAEYIVDELANLHHSDISQTAPFILQLTHVQHICRKIRARLPPQPSSSSPEASGGTCGGVIDTAFQLLQCLHPTPAVCGQPCRVAIQAIRNLEGFDRGLYAGPVGYFSSTCSEFAVALRSVLVDYDKVWVYAGAGVVPGSTAAGEWSEIGAKMKNFVKLFPPSPPLRSLPNINTLWATITIEELVRNGVSHFCIAPGARSTPLVVAVARHANATAFIHHDERGAGFYGVGYARATGKPAAVITTSGTAVANLLPSVVEASQDSLPLLLLTADRPPEERDCGANQTVHQPGMFGNYTRWWKDLPCPTDRVLASTMLSDVDYAVSKACGLHPGPVQLNFMFRENLAPEKGPVRDGAVPGADSAWSDACLETARLAQWERNRDPYTKYGQAVLASSLPQDFLSAIQQSERGLLVLGRLAGGKRERAQVRWLAKRLGWPVLADIASGLRRSRQLDAQLVSLYDQIILQHAVASSLAPKVVLQIGHPLISKRLSKLMGSWGAPMHVLVDPIPVRHDPELVVTHHITMDVATFIQRLDLAIKWDDLPRPALGLLRNVSHVLEEVLENELEASRSELTEPYVAACVSSLIRPDAGLFLSNSMAVRDVDMFTTSGGLGGVGLCDLSRVAINRGASGIDGIISTACGYATGLQRPVTLLIGDMAFLHDLNALHGLTSVEQPMTIVVVNNGGGGIFSFLPIAKHGEAVFKCLESPHSRQFTQVSKAFGVEHRLVTTPHDFREAFVRAQESGCHTIIEALTDRVANVRVHKELNASLQASQLRYLTSLIRFQWLRSGPSPEPKPVLLLLHGFLGCKEDWAPVIARLHADFDCLALDLPGHGLTCVEEDEPLLYSMPLVAHAIVGLLDRMGIKKWAVVGYSMGGRLASYLAYSNPDRCLALVAVSSSPGIQSEVERLQRWQEDVALSHRLQEHSTSEARWDTFVRWWYTKAIWGKLAERSVDTYNRMMARRRLAYSRRVEAGLGSQGPVRCLLGMSVSRQTSLWEYFSSGTAVPTLFVCGSLDTKYSAMMEEMMARAGRQVKLHCVEHAGHALLAERPEELSQEVMAFLRAQAFFTETSARSGGVTEKTSSHGQASKRWDHGALLLSLSPFSLRLKKPMKLSTGLLTERAGVLVAIQTESGVTGFGEVTPLPGFHRESLHEAVQQLEGVASQLTGSVPTPGSLGPWLNRFGSLYPSVRAGLEMAALHLQSQCYKVPIASLLLMQVAQQEGPRCPWKVVASHILVHGLLDRDAASGMRASGDGGQSTVTIMKVKVGGSTVANDLRRVNDLVSSMAPGSVCLRLDANQAWSLEEATAFVRGVENPKAIQYLEEPLKDPQEIPLLSRRCGKSIMFALDESLHSCSDKEEILGLLGMEGLSAVVLKPTILGGLDRTLVIASAACRKGLKCVVSSAFESSAGLAHLAILASVMWSERSHLGPLCTTAHGLGTYEMMAEDVVTPSAKCQGFAALVSESGSVEVSACQTLLDSLSLQDSNGQLRITVSTPETHVP